MLTSLVVVDLGSNVLSGSLPSQWQKLQALQRLDLSYNALVSTVPAVWHTGATTMAALTRLVLISNPAM